MLLIDLIYITKLKGFNSDRSLKTPFGQMAISFMGGDEDTGVSALHLGPS